MAELDRLKRHWLLLRMLAARSHGATVKEMAAETGVVHRTIRHDLLDLQRVGFPLTEAVSDHGRKHWRLGESGLHIPMQFTWDEAAALYLARRLLEPLAGTHWWDAAQSAFRKIRATFGEPALHYLDKIAVAFHQTAVGTADYSRHGDVLDQLLTAVEDRRIAFVAYRSLRSTEPVTTELYPLGIVWHRSALYLVAHSVEHGEVRHYKLDRITEVDVQPLKFNRPEGFDLRDHLADSFGIHRTNHAPATPVRVRFDRTVARYLEEKTWHPSQKLTRQRDGTIIAEFRLDDPSTEFRSWILSFGSKAVVLEPESLAQEIRGEVAAMTVLYTATTPTDGKRRLRTRRLEDGEPRP